MGVFHAKDMVLEIDGKPIKPIDNLQLPETVAVSVKGQLSELNLAVLQKLMWDGYWQNNWPRPPLLNKES